MTAERRQRMNTAVFREFGEAVRYVPQGGGLPFDTSVISRQPLTGVTEASAPGFYAEVEINPIEVPGPRLKDEVVWGEATYVVASVRQAVGANPVVALHRKAGR